MPEMIKDPDNPRTWPDKWHGDEEDGKAQMKPTIDRGIEGNHLHTAAERQEAYKAGVIAGKALAAADLAKAREEGWRDRWISVEDRLPREDERTERFEVIVYRPKSRYPVQVESIHPENWAAEGRVTGIPITHWMPMPKPPDALLKEAGE